MSDPVSTVCRVLKLRIWKTASAGYSIGAAMVTAISVLTTWQGPTYNCMRQFFNITLNTRNQWSAAIKQVSGLYALKVFTFWMALCNYCKWTSKNHDVIDLELLINILWSKLMSLLKKTVIPVKFWNTLFWVSLYFLRMTIYCTLLINSVWSYHNKHLLWTIEIVHKSRFMAPVP